MSWSSRAAGSLMVVSVFATARAASQGIKSQFGVATGATIPTGEYHAGALGGFNVGWQEMALVTFTLPALPVGFRLDVTYGVNNANDQFKAVFQSSIGRPTGEKSKLLGANVDLSYPVPSPSGVKPYLFGGIGVYHTTISMTAALLSPADTSETTLAWNVGGGIVYGTRGVALVLEARYVDVGGGLGFSCPLRTSCPRQKGPRTTFVPITAGIRFGGP